MDSIAPPLPAETPELYVSDCCGVVVVPGSTHHDDIHEAEAGVEIVVEEQVHSGPYPDDHTWRRVHEITPTEAHQYDAVRAGFCPACGEDTPGLTEIDL